MNDWNCPICGSDEHDFKFPGYKCCGCSVKFDDPKKFNAVEIFGEEVIEEVKNIFDKIVE